MEPIRRNDLQNENNPTLTESQSMYVRPVRQAEFHSVLGRGSYFTKDQDTSYNPFPGMTELKKEQSPSE